MINYQERYQEKLRGTAGMERTDAMARMVGDNFDTVGILECAILENLGLQRGHTVIDVGCGSGRLALKLRDHPIAYVGTDVVPELLQHAEGLCRRPDWRFCHAPGVTILEPAESADFVVFFSVFTHLLTEDTFRYLREAARVLKDGGQLVFSFLEFRIPCHWTVFDATVADESPGKVLNQFMDRDMIAGFAARLGLEVAAIYDGDVPHIPLRSPVTWDDGRVMSGMGYLGQSVCVLIKPRRAEVECIRPTGVRSRR